MIDNGFGAPSGAEKFSLQNWKASRYGAYNALGGQMGRDAQTRLGIDDEVTDVTTAGEDRPFLSNGAVDRDGSRRP